MESCDLATNLSCWLEVDLDAIADNVAALRAWTGDGVQLAAVVKAQAYGVGAEEVARTAIAAGASWLAVARVHEGAELRAAGVRVPILVLTRTDPIEADAAVAADLAVTVDTPELGRALGQAARRHGRRAVAHIKVDTGLHRFGVEPADALPLVRSLAAVEGLELQGLYTHFANADEPDQSFTSTQLARFRQTAEVLVAEGFQFPIHHAANSAATLGMRAAHGSLVRIGLALYGVSPSGVIPPTLALKPALALRARIGRVVTLAPGDGVGYGQTWHAREPTRVALVTAGYADGIPRSLSNRGVALAHGREVPFIGRVSMDLTTLDVTSCPEARVGSVVTFFGRDGSAELPLARFAEGMGTIPHEALTLVGGRVARVYREDGAIARTARLSGTIEATSVGPSGNGRPSRTE
jgi:alanine racemase